MKNILLDGIFLLKFDVTKPILTLTSLFTCSESGWSNFLLHFLHIILAQSLIAPPQCLPVPAHCHLLSAHCLPLSTQCHIYNTFPTCNRFVMQVTLPWFCFYTYIATCEKCGTVGVKHAFYSKSKRFCSLACSRSFATAQREGKPIVKYSSISTQASI